MDAWDTLLDVIILLSAALVLGSIAEHLGQRAIMGYLLAGMFVGPNVLGWVTAGDESYLLAELGAALLLFTIGLEFSFRRLLSLGSRTYAAGAAQILLTGVLGYLASLLAGLGQSAAIALGAAVSLSSTAFVIKLLQDRSQMDSPQGRTAVGILLLQDVAVVPLILLVASLSGDGGLGGSLLLLGQRLLYAALGVVLFYLILTYLLPRVLGARHIAQNRELPILLAVLVALGSTWAAHSAQLNPAMGAFVAGLILAESPFAVQIRSDIAALRTLLVTLFFAAIGMFGHPAWAFENIGLVSLVVLLVLFGKMALIWSILRALRYPNGVALATGLSLAQIGEFSFVVATVARTGGIFEAEVFRLILTVTVITLLVTPYLVGLAPRLAGKANRRGAAKSTTSEEPLPVEAHVVIVGYGSAGEAAARALREGGVQEIKVIDVDPGLGRVEVPEGVQFILGDATQAEVLEHAGVASAQSVIVTTSDPDTTQAIVELVGFLAPSVEVIARGSDSFLWRELTDTGIVAVNEAEEVGLLLAQLAAEGVTGGGAGGKDAR